MARVFVIEDNDGLRETIASYLRLEEHTVTCFARLAGVDEAVRMQAPDLLVLDVMLPDGDGFLFARQLRRHSQTPIVFLTARTSESDRITGFEVGGDDYVVKPFSNKELVLRIRALLRRTADTGGSSGSAGPRRWLLTHADARFELELDEVRHRVVYDGAPIVVTAAEWKILGYLADNAGVVISRDRLLGACLDYIADGSERTIDTHIKNIRIKLGRAPWIETVRGFGYRFVGTTTDARHA